jgi:hypothetical protein
MSSILANKNSVEHGEIVAPRWRHGYLSVQAVPREANSRLMSYHLLRLATCADDIPDLQGGLKAGSLNSPAIIERQNEESSTLASVN